METDPEIAVAGDGAPLAAKEMVVLIGLPKRATGTVSNVTIRGVGSRSIMLRPQIRLIEGRMPRPASTEIMAKFLRILGISLTLIFSLGAIIGAMITMYTAVATRVGEIGTMRALGFPRMSILAAFLMESLLLGLTGGLVGLFFASFLQFITISTVNFQTFSELAFSFTLTPWILGSGLLFALVMGFVGGVLPAWRAAHMKIVDALREA